MIRIEQLYKGYGGKKVLQGIDLLVQEGEILAILGRSGSGKSVLLRLILGLEKPDAGEVWIEKTCISKIDGSSLYNALKQMGMLFQGAALFDSLTVGENTSFYLRNHRNHLTNKEINKKTAHALEVVGLKDTENLMPSDLSGGMRKRAALARLIVYDPKILLIDEPTTGLDPITAMQINDLILKTQKELKATIIVVTHDLVSAFHVANRIAFIDKGTLPHLVPKEELRTIEDPAVQTFLQNADPKGAHR